MATSPKEQTVVGVSNYFGEIFYQWTSYNKLHLYVVSSLVLYLVNLKMQHGQKRINDLNYDVLVEILSKLDASQLMSIRDVCSIWRQIVDSSIGVDLHVGQSDPDIWCDYDGEDFKLVESLVEYGIKRLYLSRPQAREAGPLSFTAPHLVQYFWLDGFVSPDLLNRITSQLQLLHILELHFTTLASLSLGQVQQVKWEALSNLETLTIRMFSAEEKFKMKSVGTGVLNSIRFFESTKFPRLRQLFVSFPLVGHLSPALSSVLVTFLGRHAGSIREVSVQYHQYSLSRKHLSEIGMKPPGAVNPQVLRSLNLRLISVSLSCLATGHPAMTVLEDMVTEQRHLDHLHIITKYAPPDLAFIPVERCSRTLTSVRLTLKTGLSQHNAPVPYRPFNLQPFAACQALKVLQLFGPAEESEPTNSNGPDLTNPAALPATLQTLTLTNLLILSADCWKLVENKPNLETLRLYQAGTVGSLGMTFELVVDLLSTRRLTTLTLQGSVNGHSVVEAQNSTDRTISVAATTLLGFKQPRGRGYSYLVNIENGISTAQPVYEGEHDVSFPAAAPHEVLPLNGSEIFFFDEDEYEPYVSDQETEEHEVEEGPADEDDEDNGVTSDDDDEAFEPGSGDDSGTDSD